MILTFYFILQVTFQILQNGFLNEISSQCCKVRLPSDAFRKQLRSCCSTPSNYIIDSFFQIIKSKENLGWKSFHFFMINSWYFLQMPSGSSWQAVPAHSTMQNYTLPIFQDTFQLHPNTILGWNNKFMSKSKSSSRYLQEAVDKLLQNTFQH